jgi:hypothetical protein
LFGRKHSSLATHCSASWQHFAVAHDAQVALWSADAARQSGVPTKRSGRVINDLPAPGQQQADGTTALLRTTSVKKSREVVDAEVVTHPRGSRSRDMKDDLTSFGRAAVGL